MTIYKNDPNYEISYTSQKHTILTDGNVKIRKHNKNKKSQNLEILIKSIQSGVKLDYNKVYRDNLHQFQRYTV